MNSDKTTVVFDDDIVRKFLVVTIIWSIVGMAAGVLIASQLAFWKMNFDLPWTSFGRLRPLHTNAAIFAFVGNMMFAGIYYSVQRLCKVRMASDFLSRVHFWGWQFIIVCAAITLPLGLTRGKEYAELIWPINIMVAVIWLVFAVNFFWTLGIRRERTLYVAIWFYIATILTVTMLYVVNHLQLPTSLLHGYPIFGGVQDALVQWWYGHNAVAFFLTTPILGIMYYFMPKAAERPVYSYRLSIVHFWSLVFIYIWAGPHHLLNTALPSWLQSLGMIFSLMLWAPSWGGMLNGLLTLRGAWDKLRTDPVIKFFVAAITFYGMATFEGPLLAIKSVNALSHYTDWTIGHVHSGTLGWNGFMAAGMIYWLAPRLWNTKLYSIKLADFHFWIGMIGILFYVASMWVSGITQGLMLNAVSEDGVLKNPNFLDTVNAIMPMMHLRLLGGLLYLAGFVIMAYNIFKTIFSGVPVNGTIEVVEEEGHAAKQGVSFWSIFANPPVMYALLIIIFTMMFGVGPETLKIFALVMLIFTLIAGYLHMELSGSSWGAWYDRLLDNAMPFTVLTFLAAAIGGSIQIIPTLVMHNKSHIEGYRQIPYTPLELAGREIYIREGCYNCHSQMVRPFVSELMRYGAYSKIGESIYDHPFQWGSKRTGPDLHRVGGKYPHLWHYQHMENPRSTSVGSNMPNYDWLIRDQTDLGSLESKLKVLKKLGVPYPDRTKDQILAEALAQGQLISDELKKSQIEVAPDREIVAVIAYLQQLGKSEKVESTTSSTTTR